MLKKSFKKGFTLAEILVTIGIIGVVAAISMPSLIGNVQKKTYVTQLHKAYSDISNVMVKYMSDEKVESLRETDLYAGATSFEEFFKKYFNIVKFCGTDTGCFADSYSNLNGPTIGSDFASILNSVVLSSGAAVGIKESNINNRAFSVFIDVNGEKGPNKAGRDLFRMYIWNDGEVSGNYNSSSTSNIIELDVSKCNSTNTECTSNSTLCALRCFSKILQDNWEMNY